MCSATPKTDECRVTFADVAMFGACCGVGEEAARAGGADIADLDVAGRNLETTQLIVEASPQVEVTRVGGRQWVSFEVRLTAKAVPQV